MNLGFLHIQRLHISGHSMAPTLPDKSRVIIHRAAYRRKLAQIGEIIAFQHKGNTYVKRVAELTSTGYIMRGDNLNDSFDSRHFGAIPGASVLGKVVATY